MRLCLPGLLAVYCVRVALRYVSRNGTIGLRNYFYFVKKQGENKKRHDRDSAEKKNGSTDAAAPG